MGKRELLLIGAFVLLGLVVWHLTAPPSESSAGFSLARVWSDIRAGFRGDRVEHEVHLTGSARPGEGVRVVHLEQYTGRLRITGEDRDDVVLDVSGTAFGPDEAGAAERARALRLLFEEEEDRLKVTVVVPQSGRQPRLETTVRMPSTLAVKVEGARGDVEVSGVAASDLDSRSGSLRVGEIEGLVQGQHRGEEVEIRRVGSLKYTFRLAEVRLSQVDGDLECEMADGRLDAADVHGTTRIEARRADLVLARLGGELRLETFDNRVDIREQRDPLVFEGRRSRLSITVAGPTTIKATNEDEAIDITLVDGLGASLDLEAEDGEIRLPDDTVPVRRTDRTERVEAQIAGGGAVIEARARRGQIVIRR